MPTTVQHTRLSVRGWRDIGRNSGWLLGERALRMLLALTVGVWVARHLGPESYGVLAYVLALTAVWSGVASLGVDNLAVREMVAHPTERSAILSHALGLRLAGGSMAAVGAISTAWVLRGSEPNVVLLTTIASVGTIWALGETIDAWFQAELRADLAVAARSAVLLVGTACRVLLIFRDSGVIGFITLSCFEALASSVALAILGRRAGMCRAVPRIRGPWSGRFLRECWPNVISNFAVMGYMRLDRVMLGELLGKESVGHYAAAASLVEVWYAIPLAITASATPMLTRLYAEDAEGFLAETWRLARILVAIGFAVALLCAVSAKFIVSLLFGFEYEAAVPVLYVLPIGLVFVGLGSAVSPWYLNAKMLPLAMQRHLLGLAAAAACHILLIPRLGIVGAALATVVGFAVAHVLGNALQPRCHGLLRLQLNALLSIKPPTHRR